MAEKFKVIGMMSGTSLDGLDICEVDIWQKEVWHFAIKSAKTLSYSKQWQQNLSYNDKLSALDLLHLDHQYGSWLAEQVSQYIEEQGIKKSSVSLVASHGHTLYHQPQKSLSFQLGGGPEIFASTGLTTVTDFRKQDVVLGGQGAPLVPIGDELLFSEFDACLNLGGFANISFKRNYQRIAYDLCPVNIVLNSLAQEEGLPYDDGGQLARSGRLDQQLLEELNGLDYYQQPYPKSLGIEWVKGQVWPILHQSSVSNRDKLRTLSEHMAHQIRHCLIEHEIQECLITGGGAYNTYIIELLSAGLPTQLQVPDNLTLEYKEAVIFAFLGLLRYQGRNNVLASVTGASRDHSSGTIYR